jgi:hypothetical protein
MNGGYQSSLFHSNSSSVAQPSPEARIYLSTANVASGGGLESLSIGMLNGPMGAEPGCYRDSTDAKSRRALQRLQS